METRLAYTKLSPELYQAMLGVEKALSQSGLDHGLLELVKLRASQMNGCAFCLDMHARALRARGETQARLDTLVAWRESPFFTEKERAALAWTEVITRIAETGAPAEIYRQVLEHFSEKEVADLTWAIAAINSWNRMAIAFRAPIPQR